MDINRAGLDLEAGLAQRINAVVATVQVRRMSSARLHISGSTSDAEHP